jgi:hypothetical protein
MGQATREVGRTARLTAAVAAAAVVIGLVSTANGDGPTVARYAPTIQLQSVAVDLTAGTQTTAAVVTSDRSVAVTPELHFAPPTPEQVVATIGLVAVAAAWYAAFPVTLPVSVVGGVLLNVLVRGVSMQPITIDPAFVLKAGVSTFALAPLFLMSPVLTALGPKPTPTPQQADSTSAVRPSTEASSSRRGRGQSRVAGLRQAAHHDRTAHRATKGTSASSTKMHSGTAGSGRTVSKGTSHD